MVAAVGAPAMLGSLGFRAKAFGFKGNKIDPLAGVKRIFGMQGLIELGKSIAKVILLGGVGAWLLLGQTRSHDRPVRAGDAARRSPMSATPSSSPCWSWRWRWR